MQESDLQRASKILRTEFGSDWKEHMEVLHGKMPKMFTGGGYMEIPQKKYRLLDK